ncbi:GDSL-type esterase/lipase family protein [Streptomyces sp. NPDC059582]|uniref:GDSL-type esterase/lipase family protein n=1 Tax=Streptomyces sp. NPDC059582 TaxID=3346875 RepID=UPI0036929520
MVVGTLLGLGQTAVASRASAVGIPTQDQVRAALASAPGSNLFWTGRVGSCGSEDDSVKPTAEQYARQHGHKTLEMRLADAGLRMPPFAAPDDHAKKIWRFASAEFARQTSHQTGVVKGTCVRDDNAADKPYDVMIVGDSVSNGYEGDATWRYRLWQWADDQNWQAHFVGPLTGTEKQRAAHPPEPPPLVENAPDTVTAQPDPSEFTGAYARSNDPGFVQGGSAHYAMWGRTLGQDVGTIEAVMAAQGAQGHLPDMLLVELGFNDIGWQGAGADLVDTMKSFVDNARRANPNVQIVLADVPQRTSLGSANPQLPQRTRDYNAALARAVPTWSSPTSPVVIADIDGAMGCNPASTACATAYDGLHPNPLGEYRIASAFGAALHNAFGIGTAAPESPASVPDRQVSTPTGLVFDGTQQGVTVTWNKIVGAHSYDVQWREVASRAAKPWETAVPPARFNRWDLPWQYSFQPVDGRRYEVRVREVTGDADNLTSAWSTPVSGIAHPTTPKPPDEVTAGAAGPGEIDVGWTPVHDDSLTRYAVYVYDTDTPLVFAKVYGYAPTARPPRRITGLTPGHHYQVFICSWNASGEGMPHIAEGTVVP